MTPGRSTCWALLVAAACGPRGGKPFKATGELAEGQTACGGSLSLLGDWENEKAGELIAKDSVASIDRLEHGIRVTLADARSFVIGLDKELAPPLAVGDAVDVSITCQPVGWNALACLGAVSANGELVAFNSMTPATSGWKFTRGPLVERWPHSNYGATSHYGLSVTYDGATVTTPHAGCTELRASKATFRVSGGEVEHADPRAPDSADTSSFSVVRVR